MCSIVLSDEMVDHLVDNNIPPKEVYDVEHYGHHSCNIYEGKSLDDNNNENVIADDEDDNSGDNLLAQDDSNYDEDE